jgi:hypothetical protein
MREAMNRNLWRWREGHGGGYSFLPPGICLSPPGGLIDGVPALSCCRST